MKASKAVKLFGDKLVGLKIRTEAYALWPGGVAKVLELLPDRRAREIVLQVKGVNGQGEVGIFGNENIEIV